MEQMTVTAKIQISVSGTDRVLLDNTMSVYRDACNYVSDYVFRTHNLKQLSLNKILYSDNRENFALKSQMAQSVFNTVNARFLKISPSGLSHLSRNLSMTLYGIETIPLHKTVFQ